MAKHRMLKQVIVFFSLLMFGANFSIAQSSNSEIMLFRKIIGTSNLLNNENDSITAIDLISNQDSINLEMLVILNDTSNLSHLIIQIGSSQNQSMLLIDTIQINEIVFDFNNTNNTLYFIKDLGRVINTHEPSCTVLIYNSLNQVTDTINYTILE